jgi:hypothetical protein
MKRAIKIMMIGGLMFAGLLKVVPCQAQAQEMQQLILDIEKLTQMKGILSDMKTGYQIYQQGYGSISSLSKGNFDLHNIYLTGLLSVSPAVRNYGRIADILLMQASLISEYKRESSLFSQSGSFSVSELSYMSDVYTRLITQTLDDVEELTNIITAGKLRMSDADRIKGIDRIYGSSSDKLQFLQSFNNQGVYLSLQRSRDAADTQTLKQLYGINN